MHPVIAQRWTSRLFKNDRKGKLVAVMCANEGYLPGKVNFAVRTTSAAAGGGARPDLIQFLKAAVAGPEQEALRQQLGTDFARWVGGALGRPVACRSLGVRCWEGGGGRGGVR